MVKGPRRFSKRLLDQMELNGTLPAGSAVVFAVLVAADPLLLMWAIPGCELSQWYVVGLLLIAVTTVVGSSYARPAAAGRSVCAWST